MITMTTLWDCPDEILSYIFSFCPIGTLHSIFLTCKRYRDCSDNNVVWKSKLKELMQVFLPKINFSSSDHNDKCKEICQRIYLVFGSNPKLVKKSRILCSKCPNLCDSDCLNRRKRLISFDFGTKTSFFKRQTFDKLHTDPRAPHHKLYLKYMKYTKINVNSPENQHTLLYSKEFQGEEDPDPLFTQQYLIKHSLKGVLNFVRLPFVLCEPAKCSQEWRIKMAEHLFCQYKIQGISFMPNAIAISLLMGVGTCIVVDSGHRNTIVTPVIDYDIDPKCVCHREIGGLHLSKLLLECLKIKGMDDEVTIENIERSEFKRECYIAYDLQSEMKKNLPQKTLHIKRKLNGKIDLLDVNLSHERYLMAEDMYLHLDLPRTIVQSISTLRVPLKKILLSKILLTSGNCRLQGLSDRLTKDLKTLLPKNLRHYVHVYEGTLEIRHSEEVGGWSYIHKWWEYNKHWVTLKDFIFGEGLFNARPIPLTEDSTEDSTEDLPEIETDLPDIETISIA